MKGSISDRQMDFNLDALQFKAAPEVNGFLIQKGPTLVGLHTKQTNMQADTASPGPIWDQAFVPLDDGALVSDALHFGTGASPTPRAGVEGGLRKPFGDMTDQWYAQYYQALIDAEEALKSPERPQGQRPIYLRSPSRTSPGPSRLSYESAPGAGPSSILASPSRFRALPSAQLMSATALPPRARGLPPRSPARGLFQNQAGSTAEEQLAFDDGAPAYNLHRSPLGFHSQTHNAALQQQGVVQPLELMSEQQQDSAHAHGYMAMHGSGQMGTAAVAEPQGSGMAGDEDMAEADGPSQSMQASQRQFSMETHASMDMQTMFSSVPQGAMQPIGIQLNVPSINTRPARRGLFR